MDRRSVDSAHQETNQQQAWPGTPQHTDTMNPALRKLWLRLTPIPEDLRLYGGTALALYLGHCNSHDLEFATPLGCVNHATASTIRMKDEDEIQTATATGTITPTNTASMLSLRPLDPAAIEGGDAMVDITVRSGEEDISITMMECGVLIPQPLYRPRTAPNGVLVAHPVDLVASKLLAIMTRDTERDFIDLYAADRHWPGIITAGMETAVQANKNSASAIAKTLADPPCQSAFRLDSDIRIRLAQAGAESEEALAHHRSQGPGTVNADAEQLNYDTRPELSRWHGTAIPPVADPIAETPERCRIAERVWWHGPPWTVLRNCGQFVRSVMDYADASDARLMLADLGEERWRAALHEARPRTMSRKSYVWWSLKLGLMQPGDRCDWPYDGHANDIQPLANQSRERLYARHAAYRRRRSGSPSPAGGEPTPAS